MAVGKSVLCEIRPSSYWSKFHRRIKFELRDSSVHWIHQPWAFHEDCWSVMSWLLFLRYSKGYMALLCAGVVVFEILQVVRGCFTRLLFCKHVRSHQSQVYFCGIAFAKNGRSSPQKWRIGLLLQHSAKMLVGQMPFLSNRSFKIVPTGTSDGAREREMVRIVYFTCRSVTRQTFCRHWWMQRFRWRQVLNMVAALLVDAQGARWVEATHAAKVVGGAGERKLTVEQNNCNHGNQLTKRAMFCLLRLVHSFFLSIVGKACFGVLASQLFVVRWPKLIEKRWTNKRPGAVARILPNRCQDGSLQAGCVDSKLCSLPLCYCCAETQLRSFWGGSDFEK